MFSSRSSGGNASRCRRQEGFTIIEALVGAFVLITFGVGATVCFSLFNTRAAIDRNATAAMSVVQNYVDQTLATSYSTASGSTAPPLLAVTATGTDIDGDGVPDGVVLQTNVPIVVTRDVSQTAVVNGTLYHQVTGIGAAAPYSMTNNLSLLQVTYTLQYTFRGKTYFAKATTFKASD